MTASRSAYDALWPLHPGPVTDAHERRARVASRLAILAVLVAAGLLGDGSGHAHSHWLGLLAYAVASAVLIRSGGAAGLPLLALDIVLASYVLIEHGIVAPVGVVAGDGSSQLPAMLLLLSTGLDGNRRRTVAFGVVVAGAHIAAIAVAGARGADAGQLGHLSVALVAYAVAVAFVVEGVGRLRRSHLAALRSEKERSFLSRFVPPGTRRSDENDLRPRHVCLLAVDVRGFSELTRRHAAADVARWLLAVRRIVNEAVAAEGGIVDKYVGDGVIARFTEGRPTEQAVMARRAVDRVRARLAEANEDRAAAGLQPLRLSFALHAGTVLVGMLDDGLRAEITVLGAPMNALARIEGRAKSDGVEILASKRFARLLGVHARADARLPRREGDFETPDVIALDDARTPSLRLAVGRRMREATS